MKINRLISAYNNESRQGWSVNYLVDEEKTVNNTGGSIFL